MGICDCTIKTILFLFNLACALVGLAIIGVAVMAKVQVASVTQQTGVMGSVAIYALMGVGAFIFLISFFGCCGVTRDDSCMITTYAFILTVLLLAQIALGALALYYKVSLEKEFQQGLEQAFHDYDNNESTKQFIDSLQRQLQCCGTDGPNSFPRTNLPYSCCSTTTSQDQTCSSQNAYQEGCTRKGLDLLKSSMNILGITVLAIAAIEVICIVLACCVSNTIKREKLQGYY